MTPITAHAKTGGLTTRPAPPAGGARQRGRGCSSAGVAIPCATAAASQTLPSGQSVDLHEVLIDEVSGQTTVRFRFIAPDIARDGGTVRFTGAETDIAHLCEAVALPYIVEHAISAQSIVISLSDRIVEFGTADPDATQFFDAFRVENNTCIWEMF